MRAKRRWLAAGAALTAIVGGSAVIWGVIGADPDPNDPSPSATSVLTIHDAEAAPARLSRRIRGELVGDVRTVGVPWPRGVEPRLVIGAESYPTSVEAVDPRTGERTPLPAMWKGHSISVSPVRLTRRAVWVSWLHHVDGEERPAAMRYAVGTGRHELVLAPTVPHDARANFTSVLAYGGDGRFYFRTFRPGHDGADKFTQLWSFASGSPDDVRREGKAQSWTVNRSLLVSLDYDNAGDPVVLRIRDLATGETHSKAFKGCAEPYLEASSAYVVVACRNEPSVLVLDDTATPLARLQVPHGVNVAGFGPPSLHVGERWLTVGRLAYHPATGRLLRLDESA